MVLDVAGLDREPEEETQSIDQEVLFPPFQPLCRIVANRAGLPLPPLGIQECGRRSGRFTGLEPHPVPEDGMHAPPGAIPRPLPPIIVDRAFRRNVVWQLLPGTTRA